MPRLPPLPQRSNLAWAVGAAALLIAACASRPAGTTSVPPTSDPAAGGGFVARSVSVDGVDHRYQVFVPATRGAGPLPTLLFLHGSGERGGDGARQLAVGLGPHLRVHADRFPMLVVLPQAPDGGEWSDAAGIAMAALDAAQAEFDGDTARTSLTGISMGGYGTWELALRHPGRFAALVPVCGGITAPAHRPTLRVEAVADAPDPFAAAAARLQAVPAWIFHGARDDVVLPEQSRRMAAALRDAGAADLQYTEFPDANHNSWDAAYAHAPMWTWLQEQRLR